MKLFTNAVKVTIILLLVCFVYDLHGQTLDARTLPQFLFPKFTKGIIKMKTGNSYTANLNYNMVDEELIFEQKGSYMTIEKPQEIDTVFLQNRIFVPGDKMFYEVVAKGKAPFLIENKSKFVPKGTATAYGMTSQVNATYTTNRMQVGNQVRTLDLPDNVEISPATVNFVRRNGEMTRFINERQLLKVFPEKEAELKEFLKNEKINMKSHEDLVKLGTFCNEMLK